MVLGSANSERTAGPTFARGGGHQQPASFCLFKDEYGASGESVHLYGPPMNYWVVFTSPGPSLDLGTLLFSENGGDFSRPVGV